MKSKRDRAPLADLVVAIVVLADLAGAARAIADLPFIDGFESGAPCHWDPLAGYSGTCAMPPNDTCQTASVISFGTSIEGTTIRANPNYDSGLETCTGYQQPGPDVVYSMFLTASQDITVTLSSPSPDFDAAIALVGPGAPSVCDAQPVICVAGADVQFAGGGETFQFTASQSGSYFLIVDSAYVNGSGNFTLTVTSP